MPSSTPADFDEKEHTQRLARLDLAMQHPDFGRVVGELSKVRTTRRALILAGALSTPAHDADIIRLSARLRAMADLEPLKDPLAGEP